MEAIAASCPHPGSDHKVAAAEVFTLMEAALAKATIAEDDVAKDALTSKIIEWKDAGITENGQRFSAKIPSTALAHRTRMTLHGVLGHLKNTMGASEAVDEVNCAITHLHSLDEQPFLDPKGVYPYVKNNAMPIVAALFTYRTPLDADQSALRCRRQQGYAFL